MSSSGFSPPAEFDEYRLIRPLGKGGMGSVYLGQDLLLDRAVAVKFIADALPTAQSRQRFRIEAVALARLQHPNVMAVFRASQVAGHPYIVGELVGGKSLEQTEKPISPEQCLSIALGLSRGLAAAHRRGVLHRDLKPSNVILAPDGQPKLVDFGIAKLVAVKQHPAPGTEPVVEASGEGSLALAATGKGVTTVDGNPPASMETDAGTGTPAHQEGPLRFPVVTQAGARLGTPLYMAPEVWKGEPATSRSDVYSLGVILYELCSGHTPHQAESMHELGLRVTQTDAPPLVETAFSNKSLAAIIERCLRRAPEQRYSSASELEGVLEQLAGRLALRRKVAVGASITVGVILALSVAANALFNWARTQRSVARHLADAQAALRPAQLCNKQVEVLRRHAFAAFDTQQAQRGEKLWAETLALARQCYAGYQQATRSLDAALILDPQRTDVRRHFAQALYEQAVLLDQDNRATQRDEVLARLESYASLERPEYVRRWNQSGRVEMRTVPESAVVDLAVYSVDPQGRRSLQELGSRGTTPLSGVVLSPGSYLFTIKAPDRPAVRLPLLLRRGEQLSLRVYLPSVAEIPVGFVYVPAGRALFGASGDESVRAKILQTTPLHEITTDSYFIARTETTFGEWIEFLDALPAELQETHRPRSRGGTSQAEFGLNRSADHGWSIVMSPVEQQLHDARSGEPIIYPQRERRQTADWRRLPVVGIAMDDALAYVAWLHETGRVVGARLCTEHEWERAARGADGREYPHGDFLDTDDANIDTTYAQETLSMGPDEVGAHPASRSPFGVDDLSGNVWEMVVSSAERSRLVLRGGAFYFDSVTARVNNRKPVERALRDQRLGLRVCASLPAR